MTKRVLTSLLALSLAFGAAACSGDKEIDKEGSVEQLVEQGIPQGTAECIVDGIDAEFGDNQDVLDIILDDSGDVSDLSDQDEATLDQITTDCVAGAPTETTVGG
jgi:hypothetical protein